MDSCRRACSRARALLNLSPAGGEDCGCGASTVGVAVLALRGEDCAGELRACAAQRTYSFEMERMRARSGGGASSSTPVAPSGIIGEAWMRRLRESAADAWDRQTRKLAEKPVMTFIAVLAVPTARRAGGAGDDADGAAFERQLDAELMASMGSSMRVLPRGGRGIFDGDAEATGKCGLCVASCDVTFDDLLYGENLTGSRDIGAQAYISDVSVIPQMRRRGIGRTLVQTVVRFVLSDGGGDGGGGGATSVYIHVDEDNAAAAALYARCGFVEETRESTQEAARRTGGGPTCRRMLLRWTGVK